MLRFAAAAALIVLAAPVHGGPDDAAGPFAPGPVVVELFTSQGCSACPSADRVLAELAGRDGVIALALHVDYWDYIGWEDEFASPSHTLRQKAYAHQAGERMIYTPQMIVQGEHRVVGTRPGALARAIMDEAGRGGAAELTLERDGAEVVARARAERTFEPPLVVQMARYDPKRHSAEITSGENAGHTLDYVHVVTDWEIVGHWDGATPLEARFEASGDAPAVMLLQEPGPGRVIAAAEVR